MLPPPGSRRNSCGRKDVGTARQPEGTDQLEVQLLGGLPIRERIAHYGPFLVNTRQEILEALEDFQAGRMGVIPAADLGQDA